MKNGKRDVVKRDYAESIIDGLDFEVPTVDDRLPELKNDFNFGLSDIAGDGNTFDLSVDIGHNAYLQHHASTVAGSKDVGSFLKTESEQLGQKSSGLELMIIPITFILFFKSLMQGFEKRGQSSGRIHTRQWREITV